MIKTILRTTINKSTTDIDITQNEDGSYELNIRPDGGIEDSDVWIDGSGDFRDKFLVIEERATDVSIVIRSIEDLNKMISLLELMRSQ